MKLHNDTVAESDFSSVGFEPSSNLLFSHSSGNSGEEPKSRDPSEVIQRSVSCVFCRTTFETFRSYEHHLCGAFVERIDIGEEGALSYACLVCSQRFADTNLLREHIIWHRKHESNHLHSEFRRLKINVTTNQNVFAKIEKYTCPHCGKSFLNGTLFLKHVKGHTDANNNNLEKLLADSNDKKNVYCEICCRRFEHNFQYTQHMLGHAKYSCSPCNLSFSTKKLFDKHQHANHGVQIETKNHECPMCHKMFHRPKYLTFHLRTHSKEMPITCTVCKTSFSNNAALAQHEKTRSHLKKVRNSCETVEKPFLCHKCGLLFHHERTLTMHIKQNHDENIKYAQCPHCEYKTQLQQNLKRHVEETHKNVKRFVCELCGAAFGEQVNLMHHYTYVHSDKRDFVCTLCSKQFKSKRDLTRHVGLHSEHRPYQCHCNHSFKRLAHLKRHMKSVHNMSGKTFEFNDIITPENITDQLETLVQCPPLPPSYSKSLNSSISANFSAFPSMPTVPFLKNALENKAAPAVVNGNELYKDISSIGLPPLLTFKNDVQNLDWNDANGVMDIPTDIYFPPDDKDFDPSLLNSSFVLPLEDVSKLEDIQPSVFTLFPPNQENSSAIDLEWTQIDDLSPLDSEDAAFDVSGIIYPSSCAMGSQNNSYFLNTVLDDFNQDLDYFAV